VNIEFTLGRRYSINTSKNDWT